MSRLVVHKYGGTSVASLERLHAVADIIAAARQCGEQVVAVVSAMRGEDVPQGASTTDQLLDLSAQALGREQLSSAADVSPEEGREVDALVVLGEMATAPLLALILQKKGIPALSLNTYQAGLRLGGKHGEAKITDVNTEAVERAIQDGKVPVLVGFQGLNDNRELAAMPRGCSDTSAVAIAAKLQADECLIYTDVPGIHTADPRVVPQARPLPEVLFEEMIEAAMDGVRVLHPRSLRLAQRNQVPMRVLSAFEPDKPGTRIVASLS